MAHSTTASGSVSVPTLTLGLDLGDRHSEYCLLGPEAQPLRRGSVATTREALGGLFGILERSLIVMEVGGQSAWISRLAREAGHQVLVANARRVALITRDIHKDDRKDAELLARLGRADRELLSEIHHRSEQTQADLAVVRARSALIQSRTQLVNHVRGIVKLQGHRIKICSAESFHRQAAKVLPAELERAVRPLLVVLERLSEQIKQYDQTLEAIAQARYPQTELLRQIPGVGHLVALVFLLVIEDPGRFTRSRQVGPYLGLTPRTHISSQRNPQLRISKAGDKEMRRLLVVSANYILGRFGPDCDLRRWGLQIAERGAKNARKRAKVAVARRLAVVMHHLLATGQAYDPFHVAKQRG